MVNGSAVSTSVAPVPAATSPRSSALAVRRWVLVGAPVVAGLLAIGGALADPAMDVDGEAMYEIYAANPDPLQWKSTLYHFSYAVWGLAALMLVSVVRGRGSWLANVAGVLAFLGISTLPGLLFVDFYDSAIGREFGVEGTLAVERAMESMWGPQFMAGSGAIGFLSCLPVAALAAWRAGILRWWGAVAPIAGIGIGLLLVGANVLGWGLLTVGFAVLSVGLARGTRPGGTADGVPTDA